MITNNVNQSDILLNTLIAQLKCQDPMNPMDKKDMLQFMQQISQVQELQEQNVCLKKMLEKIENLEKHFVTKEDIELMEKI